MKFIGVIKKIPKIIGIQAKGSSFLHSAFHQNKFDLSYRADTIADSISVNVARNGYTAVADLEKVNGDLVLADDKEILNAQKYISQMSGIFCEPSSAASFAGFLRMKDQVPRGKRIVFLLTGHGLKDIDGAMKALSFPRVFEPDIEQVMKSFGPAR